MKGLTDKQKAILSFIAESKENTGVFPSLSEIAEHFSFSTPAAYYALSALEEKGYLSHEKGEHRAYILSGLERANRENTADRKSTRLNSSHKSLSRMPSSA